MENKQAIRQLSLVIVIAIEGIILFVWGTYLYPLATRRFAVICLTSLHVLLTEQKLFFSRNFLTQHLTTKGLLYFFFFINVIRFFFIIQCICFSKMRINDNVNYVMSKDDCLEPELLNVVLNKAVFHHECTTDWCLSKPSDN